MTEGDKVYYRTGRGRILYCTVLRLHFVHNQVRHYFVRPVDPDGCKVDFEFTVPERMLYRKFADLPQE